MTQYTGSCGFEGQSQYTEWTYSNFNWVATGSTAQQPLTGSPQDYNSPGGNCPPNGPQPSMLQLGGTISSSGNAYTIDFYPSLNGSGSATVNEVGAAGYINPKYVIVGVTYAPPGPQSYISYSGTTAVGNTTTISSSFSAGVGFSVSVKASINAWGTGGAITGSESTNYTQQSNTSNTTTIIKSTSVTHQTTGTGSAFSPVNSDYDIIWLWLNPVVLLTYTPANGSGPASMIWNGYGYDPSDPSGRYQMDIYPVAVGWLNGHFGDDPSIDAVLARSWVSSQTWATGEGPGLTSADKANIIAADPLTNPNYTQLEQHPYTTSDGRFTLMDTPTGTPNPIPYVIASPGNGAGITTAYDVTQTDNQSQAQGASNSFNQAFGLQETFGGTLFGTGITTTLNQSQILTWKSSYLNTLTTTTTLNKGLSVTGPPCPAPYPGPCNPSYSGPGQFLVYQDNLYGTFVFYPSN